MATTDVSGKESHKYVVKKTSIATQKILCRIPIFYTTKNLFSGVTVLFTSFIFFSVVDNESKTNPSEDKPDLVLYMDLDCI